MSLSKNCIITLVVLFFSCSLTGQSLLKDSEDLVKAIKTIKTISSLTYGTQLNSDSATYGTQTNTDSLTHVLSIEALAILYCYDRPYLQDSISADLITSMLDDYADNLFIQKIAGDSILKLPDTLSVGLINQFRQSVRDRRSGTREKLLDLLQAKNAVSPADYISVSSTLEQYRIPPVPPAVAMRKVASESNNNIANGIINPQAEIIEGIFKFVLNGAKDEVVINFLERLLDDETPHLRKLFPTVVNQFDNRELTYSNSLIQRVRSAFYEDFQLLSLRLPELLLTDDYFGALQGNPITYNFLALYSIIGMSHKDIPIDEILPVTHRFLYQSYSESNKEVNLQIADKGVGSQEYKDLYNNALAIITELNVIYSDLIQAEERIEEGVEFFRDSFNLAADSGPYVNDFLFKEAYDLEVLLGGKNSNDFDLYVLPCLLNGEFDTICTDGYNTLASFDKFFGLERTAQQWRAAGLDILRKLNGTWYSDQSFADILYAWQHDLASYNNAVNKWKQANDPEGVLRDAYAKVDQNRVKLVAAIQDEAVFWDSIRNNQTLALRMLANIMADFEEEDFSTAIDDILGDDDDSSSIDDILNDTTSADINASIDDIFDSIEDEPSTDLKIKILDNRRQKILEVEERLYKLHDQLKEQNPGDFRASPVRKYQLDTVSVNPFTPLINRIDLLRDRLRETDEQFETLENLFARNKSRARENAKPVLQTTELLTKLMYCIRSDEPGQHWVKMDSLNALFDGQIGQVAFLGLMQQLLRSVKNVDLFSPDGLAQLTQLTLTDLNQLQNYQKVDTLLADSLQVKDSLLFFHKASFAINTLNRVFELPLIADQEEPGTYQALVKTHPNLKIVPEASKKTLDFIYFLNIKDHSKAVSSLIQIFTMLDADVYESIGKKINKGKKTRKGKGKNKGAVATPASGITATIDKDSLDGKRQTAIQYFIRYGDFIADLIDAKNSDQVEDLISNIADPPGSSRIKRRRKVTVGINSYLGVAAGMETWDGNALEETENFFSVTPTMPVGLSISWLSGEKEKSYSFYISLIDLGGLINYRSDSGAIGESDFTFKNVLKPGFQFHQNLKKSPFYIGVGTHFGPQNRTINGSDRTLNTYRIFAVFGVDVPIKTLYQKYKKLK